MDDRMLEMLRSEALQDVAYLASFSELINTVEEACFYGEPAVHIRINAHDTYVFEYVAMYVPHTIFECYTHSSPYKVCRAYYTRLIQLLPGIPARQTSPG